MTKENCIREIEECLIEIKVVTGRHQLQFSVVFNFNFNAVYCLHFNATGVKDRIIFFLVIKLFCIPNAHFWGRQPNFITVRRSVTPAIA